MVPGSLSHPGAGRPLVRWLLGSALLWLLLPVLAQTLDDLRVVDAGNGVARISFNATVRVVQQSPAPGTAADLFRITVELVGADESVRAQTTDEVRRVGASGRVPELSVTYVAAPSQRMKELVVQLRAPAVMQARPGPSGKAVDLVFSGAPAVSAQQAATAAAPASDKRYAVLLQSVPVTAQDQLKPVPYAFQSYDLFATNSVADGVPMLDVNIGYFATQAEAEAVRNAALQRFPDAKVVDLAQRREEVLKATAESVARAPAAAAAPADEAASAPAAPPAPVAAAPEIETRAQDLMSRSRQALAGRRHDEAVNLLNQLLLLPPNTQSQEAQELIGVAWERAGNPRRARTEYELYLRLFPEGEGAQRVRQRLAAMEGGAPPASAAAAAPEAGAAAPAPSAPASAGGIRYNGNIAQYYFGGKARSQSLVNLSAGIDQSTLTRTTESAIVTSVDLGGRYNTPDSETRVVVRGTGSANLVSTSHNTSTLNAAYVDYKRAGSGLAVRIGRQSPIAGGLLGYFDGVSLTYPVRDGWRVDLMGGVPANTLVSSPSERLLAGMVEADGLFEHWGGDVYIVDQTTQGITNRRSLGGELRYADDRASVYSLLDYDTLFRVLNAASLQGSLQVGSQTTVTLLLDSRKAPSLEMTNALISYPAASLKELMQIYGLTMDQVRGAARATTAEAKQGLLSVSTPVSEKWQLAADLRYSEIGALPQVGDFQATPATGSQYGMTVQLTGNNLYSKRDINNFNLSVLRSPLFKGAQLAYNNLTGLRDNDLTVEPSIRLYRQTGSDGLKLMRITPGLRLSYRLSTKASLLGEGIVEHSKSDGPTSHDTTNSVFFYLGYRYELF